MVELAQADQTQGNADAAASGTFEIAQANQTVAAWSDLVGWASPTTDNPGGLPGLAWIVAQYQQSVVQAAWQPSAVANEATYAQALGDDEVGYAENDSSQFLSEVTTIDAATDSTANQEADDNEGESATLMGDEATFEGLAQTAYDNYQSGEALAIYDYRVANNQDEQAFLNGLPDDGTNEFYTAMENAVQGSTASLRDQFNTQFYAAANQQTTDDALAVEGDTDEIDNLVLSTNDGIDGTVNTYDLAESGDYDQQQRDDAQALYNMTTANSAGLSAEGKNGSEKAPG